jgi:hypothetical protein
MKTFNAHFDKKSSDKRGNDEESKNQKKSVVKQKRANFKQNWRNLLDKLEEE